MAGTEKTGFFSKLKDGLKKTRDNLYVAFSGATIVDEDFYDNLEEVMIMSDMGVVLSEKVIDQLREVSETKHIQYPTVLRRELVRILNAAQSGEQMSKGQQKFNRLTAKRDFALLSLFLGTGIRVSECVGMNISDVDFEENAFIGVSGGKKADGSAARP